jgi:hypothetical protein
MGESTELSVDLFTMARARRRSRIHGRRILYVDDDLLMRLSVARLLRGAGAVCIGTDTHDRAVVLLPFEPLLDLAILDFQMPDGDVGRLVRRPLPGKALDARRTDPRRGLVGSARKPGRGLQPLRSRQSSPPARAPLESAVSELDLPGSGDAGALCLGAE